MAPPAWTRPADVREAVRKKWGALLTAYAAGQEWAPLNFPLRGPGPAEIGERLGEVQKWAGEWEQATRGPVRVEYKKVGGRHIGANLIPGRAWVDGYEQAWALLGAAGEIRRLAELTERTRAACPRLVPWLTAHPVKALALAPDWGQLLATVAWIDQRQTPRMYLRQVDVPGVDTKFIERHKGVLTDLLDQQLDAVRIDPESRDFEARFHFRRKPAYVRFRSGGLGDDGFSELTVRADEFTAPPPRATRVYIVENEVTYLAFPLPADAMVILGGGYAVPVLESLAWLTALDVIYWGDIDTHGFAILNRLRHHVPHARSILMDRATLLAHREQWVREPTPTAAALELLNAAEQALYHDLVVGQSGPAVRLEQERISFASIEQALAPSPAVPVSQVRVPIRGAARTNCGRLALVSMAGDRDVAGELTVDGRARTFLLRLPLSAVGEIPLLLVLHGNHPDASGRFMREWTTFDEQADEWGFAVAYPDGCGGCWADGRGVTTADEAGVDDVAFLRAIIGWSAGRHGTVPDRAVVAGISNGAFMAHRMGLEASDLVAVIAAVAGGLPASLRDRPQAHAVSAMLIHGTADTISPIEGGYSRHRGPNGELRGRTLSLEDTAGFWRATDRCPPQPADIRATEFSARTTWAGGAGGTRVTAWTVFEGGHTWPGSTAVPELAQLTTGEFDAAEEICRFAEPLLASADIRRLSV